MAQCLLSVGETIRLNYWNLNMILKGFSTGTFGTLGTLIAQCLLSVGETIRLNYWNLNMIL